MLSALLTVKAPPSSKFKTLTTWSSTSMENRRLRMPKPLSVRSSSTPQALVKTALPSASSMILSPAPTLLPQASITKASFTLRQAMVSTPLALISSARSTKPGKCLRLHVGVKAPGTAKMTTFLPLHRASVSTSFMLPSVSKYLKAADGRRSPTAMACEATWRVACAPLEGTILVQSAGALVETPLMAPLMACIFWLSGKVGYRGGVRAELGD
mmetsp:Transcript_17212/g.29416  ORF Transcript_17212/g.29416 Transcript_17212/m.29416 type:complete len:213 (-) Transcript_17212:51-689(-)